MKSSRPLLIFDLDETLMHASKTSLSIEDDGMVGDFYIYHRPHLEPFLQGCAEKYAIGVWSSAEDAYVTAVVKMLFPAKMPLEFVWGRSECWLKSVKVPLGDPQNGHFSKEHRYIKPLQKLVRKGYKMQRMLIVDDSKSKVEDNPGNYILVPPYEGNPQDEALPKLMKWLRHVDGCHDMRTLSSLWEIVL